MRGGGSGVKGGEWMKVTIEIPPEEAAVLLREIVKAPQTQAGWSPIKEGVDVDALKAELANGHAHDLICEHLHKLHCSRPVCGIRHDGDVL